MKKALITGITGQDGSYLTELLLDKGYKVHGIIRRSSSFNTGRIDHIINDEKYKDRFFFHHGDVTDSSNINRLLEKIEPDEIYNLAAQSHVKVSFEIPDYTAQVDALGTLRFIDAIRKTGIETKFYQASSSELYGKVQDLTGLSDHLESKGIQTRGFFYPMHKQPCFNSFQFDDNEFNNSNQLHEQGMVLPVYPALKEENILFICDSIIEFFN